MDDLNSLKESHIQRLNEEEEPEKESEYETEGNGYDYGKRVAEFVWTLSKKDNLFIQLIIYIICKPIYLYLLAKKTIMQSKYAEGILLIAGGVLCWLLVKFLESLPSILFTTIAFIFIILLLIYLAIMLISAIVIVIVQWFHTFINDL